MIEDWYNKILSSKDNQYHILKHLSTSGYGECFLAMTSENYLVCLKIFMEKKYLENEIENLKLVNRKLEDIFLPYLDYFIINSDSESFYIMVMKYFEGWIIVSDYLKKCLFYEEQKSQIQNKLNIIVHKLHKLQIIHHDIDVHTILVHSKTTHIRLLDLGFCITRFSNSLSEEDFEIMKRKDMDVLSKEKSNK